MPVPLPAREAALPIFEADRHAKEELKKAVRGVRPIERAVEGRGDAEARVVRGYCAAVRSALTDDGRPPLAASGLTLRDRLAAVAASLDRGAPQMGDCRARCGGCAGCSRPAWSAPGTSLWPDIARADRWVHALARVLDDADGLAAARVERRFAGLIGALARHRAKAGALAGAVDRLLLKVTRSYRPGLFACYRVPELPRTNNDLERLFGSQRHHERRATGRRSASPAMVLRGSVRLVAATATRLRPVTAGELARADRRAWAELRRRLDDRRRGRTLRSRFRRDPAAYLADLEQQLSQLTLPS